MPPGCFVIFRHIVRSSHPYFAMNQKTTWLLGIMALAFGCLIGFFQIHNADIWWHIAWGEKMLEQLRAFPAAESFYFTTTSSAYLHDLPNTFLGDIGLALLYNVGGVLGLQLLVLACLFLGGALVILSPFGKQMLANKSRQHLALLLFLGFCLGTSQLQLVRNSLASLFFFPLVLAIYSWHVRHGGWKTILFYPGIFLAWSLIHSSYILGIISLLILYAGLFFDQKNNRILSRSYLFIVLVLLFITMSVTLTYSCQAQHLMSDAVTRGWEAVTETVVRIENLRTSSTTAHSDFSLTSMVLKPLWNSESKSGDFIPTWKIFRHPAAWSSLLLSLVALLFLLLNRLSNKIGRLMLLGCTTYFGICYFRGTGYATITAVFIIASILSDAPLSMGLIIFKNRLSWIQKRIIPFSTIVCFLALSGILYLTIAKKSEYFFMERGRVFGCGKAAIFEDAAYNFVKNHFLNEPCFTTMVTGSYALVNWKDQKKVFIDAFFAPHPSTLWHDYDQAFKMQNLTFLDQYEVQVAIIENTRLDWQSLFLNSPEWQPIAIGLGTTVYIKQNKMTGQLPVEVLFTLAEVNNAPSLTTRRAVATAFYNSILALQLHGNGGVAAALMKKHRDLFKNLVGYLSLSQRGNIRQEPAGIKPTMLIP